MFLRARKPNQMPMTDTKRLFLAPRSHRRWRKAFTVIYATRALVSLSKKIFHDQTSIIRSLSYVTVQVDDDDDTDSAHSPHVPLENADQKLLSRMVREKNSDSLNQLGGAKHIAVSLGTDVKEGIVGSEADLAQRSAVFGANRYQKPPAKGFLSFVLEAIKDTTIIILFVCAVLSLSFGIKQHGPKEGWYDGGSIIVAIFLVVAVSAVSNFKQSRQFMKLSNESSDIKVQVVRDGRHQPISIFDVVVGDVVSLKIGDQIPADGLFLDGYSLRVDESSMTGESDHVEVNGSTNPFLLSGTKVSDGFGSMLVTSVGMNTAWVEMMSSVTRDLDEQTPLQIRLNRLTSYIGKVGMMVAVLVLAILAIRYFTGNTRDENGNKEYNGSKTKVNDILNSVVQIIAAAVTIVVVAIPEGLPLAVTLTLAYSMKQMMSDNALVRKLSEERMQRIDDIRVMARSSPLDKLLMVQCLKEKGHVVAVTGDGTNDAPALKAADIGLSMGIQGTEVAKECSDIVILDDNFTSVVTVLRWGRCVYNNIQKFIQFQLTVNVAALVINFVAAISSGKVPLTAVQLLWVNLIMDTMGALALATEQPTNDLMTKPPAGRSGPLISKIMWRNLIPQALYQVAILLVLEFKGKAIFDVDEKVKNTLIFNTFVLCQVFNEFNARKLEKKNIFSGLNKSKLFLAIIGITIILQVVMVELLKRFATTERLTWGQWVACIGIAAASWPIGYVVKFIPVQTKQLPTRELLDSFYYENGGLNTPPP